VSLLDRAVARVLPAVLPLVPRPVVARLAARYIAGAQLADAIGLVGRLAAAGKQATLDVLGEAARTRDEVAATVAEYRAALAALHAGGLPSGISVKPTALGVAFDAGLCRASFEELAREAAARGRFLRIDMEASPTIDATLGLYRELRAAGHGNVGIALQARLRRTLDDVRALAELSPDVRLCKGIYVEPAAVAFQEPAAVRTAYVRALELLLAAGSRLALATHDEWLLGESLRLVEQAGLGPDGYEVQMLLGVREERATRLVADGRRVRVYVPYGVRWYEYSLRRLLENPGMAVQIATATVARTFKPR
jgi:proline dehydrogenase